MAVSDSLYSFQPYYTGYVYVVKRFLTMIGTSTVVEYILMYSTAYAFSHVWWSQTRFWMALYMGAMMAVIRLGFMLSMYSDKKTRPWCKTVAR